MNKLKTIYQKYSMLIRVSVLTLGILCTALLAAQTAYARSTTYVVTDGDRVLVHTTYATDPADVVKELGIALEDTDILETEPTDDGFAINVVRGMSITVNVCGNPMEFLSYGETLGELLERNGIILKETFGTSIDLDAQVEDGMTVDITDTVITNDSYSLTVPFETIYQDTDLLPAGKEIVLTAGVAGQKLCTAEVVYINGQESVRTVLSEKVTNEPVNRVIARGTGNGKPSGKKMPIIGDGVIITPEGDVLTYTHVDTFKATSYNRTEVGGQVTSTGTQTRVGVVAVDPRVIPYGTRMYIVTKDGHYIYGVGTAEDCGGDIKNKRLDLFYETDAESRAFGVRDCYVYFLG